LAPSPSTLGHHTVYQHANFEFGLENISRQFVWTFLHSYPFYNSEQSSQRYVRLREPRAFVPPITGEALGVYESAVVKAWDRYEELSALLKDDAFAILKELRYVRPTTNPERLKQIEKDAVKRAIETARYVIPIGAFTSMVHTVSGIVLHRLQRMMHTGDAPYEARAVISEMVRPGKGVGPAVLREGRCRDHRAGRRDGDDVPEAARRRRRLRRAVRRPP
jgi:thymidylate synthase ThyX